MHTSYVESYLKMCLIWIFNLLGVEVTTATTTDSQEPACWFLNKVGVNIPLAL